MTADPVTAEAETEAEDGVPPPGQAGVLDADLEYAYRGVRGTPDRGVLLAHGAGSDMRAAVLVAVSEGLAAEGVPSLRFNFPYRTRGKRAPDRPPVLESAVRAAVDELSSRSGLGPERLVVGGRSMGGRYASMVAGHEEQVVPALGLLLLGYPLHPPGKPDRLRVDHFPRLTVPTLFVSGTRDAMASRALLEREAAAIPGAVSFHWLDTADHGFRPLKSSGRTLDDVVAEVVAVSVEWVLKLR